MNNAQVVNGVRFATLDDTAAMETATGSQTDFVALPTGWAVAAPGSLAQLAAFNYPWGTDCLVLADGSMVATSTRTDCTRFLVGAEADQVRPVQRRVLIAETGTPRWTWWSCR